jgi:D-alanine-D-alanine ligase
MKKKIAIIAGGDSHEREISLLSAQTVLDAIDKELFDAHLVVITDDEWICHYHKVKIPVNKGDFCLDVDGQHFHFDAAFITVHGTPGEDGLLQAYFDLLKIPYTTPNHSESTLTFNKWMCNHLLNSLGYACAKSVLLRGGDLVNEDAIVKKVGLPCFVKPNDSGSSYGVKKVNEKVGLQDAILHAFEHGKQVLIESFLDGVEVTNGAFAKQGKIMVLPITEIVTENDFFDYEAKYEGKSSEITPARLSGEITQLVKTNTELIYHDLGLKGMVRIDYMIVNDVPHVIEINTTPGLAKESIIPQQAQAVGITLTELFTTVIQEALND